MKDSIGEFPTIGKSGIIEREIPGEIFTRVGEALARYIVAQPHVHSYADAVIEFQRTYPDEVRMKLLLDSIAGLDKDVIERSITCVARLLAIKSKEDNAFENQKANVEHRLCGIADPRVRRMDFSGIGRELTTEEIVACETVRKLSYRIEEYTMRHLQHAWSRREIGLQGQESFEDQKEQDHFYAAMLLSRTALRGFEEVCRQYPQPDLKGVEIPADLRNGAYVFVEKEAITDLDIHEWLVQELSETVVAVPYAALLQKQETCEGVNGHPHTKLMESLESLYEKSEPASAEQIYYELLAQYYTLMETTWKDGEFAEQYNELVYMLERAWVEYIKEASSKESKWAVMHSLEGDRHRQGTRSHDLAVVILGEVDYTEYDRIKKAFVGRAAQFLAALDIPAGDLDSVVQKAHPIHPLARINGALDRTMAQVAPDSPEGSRDGKILCPDPRAAQLEYTHVQHNFFNKKDPSGVLAEHYLTKIGDPDCAMAVQRLLVLGHELAELVVPENLKKDIERPSNEEAAVGLPVAKAGEAKSSLLGIAMSIEHGWTNEKDRELIGRAVEILFASSAVWAPYVEYTGYQARVFEKLAILDCLLRSGLVELYGVQISIEDGEAVVSECPVEEAAVVGIRYNIQDRTIKEFAQVTAANAGVITKAEYEAHYGNENPAIDIRLIPTIQWALQHKKETTADSANPFLQNAEVEPPLDDARATKERVARLMDFCSGVEMNRLRAIAAQMSGEEAFDDSNQQMQATLTLLKGKIAEVARPTAGSPDFTV